MWRDNLAEITQQSKAKETERETWRNRLLLEESRRSWSWGSSERVWSGPEPTRGGQQKEKIQWEEKSRRTKCVSAASCDREAGARPQLFALAFVFQLLLKDERPASRCFKDRTGHCSNRRSARRVSVCLLWFFSHSPQHRLVACWCVRDENKLHSLKPNKDNAENSPSAFRPSIHSNRALYLIPFLLEPVLCFFSGS